MRLLVVSQYFWPENFRINDFVAEMVTRGHQVTVLTGIPNYPEGTVNPDFLREPEKFREWSGAEIIRVPIFVRGQGPLRLVINYASFLISASLGGVWKLRGRSFDVIFVCQLSPVTSALPAVLLRSIKRTPLVMWVLDLWPDSLSAVGAIRSKWILSLVGWFVAFIYQHCDLILAQSRSFKSSIQRLAGDEMRVEYFPSWAESIFSNGRVERAEEIPASPKSFNVMFAGNIGDAQDFPSILRAAEILHDQPDIRWWIVGDGRAAGWVAAEIERRHLTGKVIMLGRYPLERMPSFFKHADALLVTLRDEPIFSMTIPGKIPVYLATGIPIVAMLNGEGARLISESSSGLVSSAGNAQGLAQSILKLHQMSPDERKEIGVAAARTYKRDFDRAVLMGRVESWLLNLKRQAVTPLPHTENHK